MAPPLGQDRRTTTAASGKNSCENDAGVLPSRCKGVTLTIVI